MEVNGTLFKVLRRIRTPLFCFVAAAILFTMVFLGNMLQSTEGLPKVDATIAEIAFDDNGTYDTDDDMHHVYVVYTVDGIEYSAELGHYNSTMDVGETVEVSYDPANPGEPVSNTAILGYVLLGIGSLCLLIAIISTVRSIAGARKYAEQEKKFATNTYDPSFGADTFFEEGVEHKYYYHPDTSKGYSDIMEDENRAPVYVGSVQKLTMLRPQDVQFTNHITGHSQMHQIGHTRTINKDRLDAESYFTYDGQNVWDYLHGKGIRIATKLSATHLDAVYTVTLNGKPFATVTTSGIHLHEDDPMQQGVLSQVSVRGFYRIVTTTEDVDLLFLVVYAFAHTEQLAYD